jgi:hypothetical protein
LDELNPTPLVLGTGVLGTDFGVDVLGVDAFGAGLLV